MWSQPKKGNAEIVVEFLNEFTNNEPSDKGKEFGISDGKIVTPFLLAKEGLSDYCNHLLWQLHTERYIELEARNRDQKTTELKFQGKPVYLKEFWYEVTGYDLDKIKKCTAEDKYQIRISAGKAKAGADIRKKEIEEKVRNQGPT